MDKNSPASLRPVAIVLAGDRSEPDPVAEDAGVSCKAVAPVCGRPMILRVLDALAESKVIERIVLCGPPRGAIEGCSELAERIDSENITWLENLDSPGLSVEAALEHIDKDSPVLLTTADHALLRGEVVSYFISRAAENNADAIVGLVEYATINDAYPEVRRTVIKFSNGGFCGCNLFAFMNAEGKRLVPFWRQVEQRRKSPVRMLAGVLGVFGVLRYLTGNLSLESALGQVSRRLDLNVKPVILPFPRAGIDVDTAADRQFVEKLLAE